MANVLTNLGRYLLGYRLMGSGSEPKQIGIGTGSGTSAVADTTLFTEVSTSGASTGTRVAGTSSQTTTSVSNDTYQVSGTLTATAALAVTNAGLWDNSTIGSGNLFMKGDFTSISLASGDSLTLTFKLQFS